MGNRDGSERWVSVLGDEAVLSPIREYSMLISREDRIYGLDSTVVTISHDHVFGLKDAFQL